MVVRDERAVVLEEVQEVRHLLEVGRDVRVVAPIVRVVELQIDHVLDLPVLVAELAVRRRCRGRAAAMRDTGDESCSGAQRDHDRAEECARLLAHRSPPSSFLSDSGAGD